jgi:cell division protein FtsB
LSETTSIADTSSYPPVLVAVVVSLLLLLAIAGFGSYRDLEAAHQRQQLLEMKIDATRQRNEDLAQRIRRLQDDPAAIERLAREQYRMMRPGDVVVVLPDEPAVATAAAPPANDSL